MAGKLVWRDGPSRLETSTRSSPAIEGWITALNFISKIGLEAIGKRIVCTSNKFRIQLNDIIRNRSDVGIVGGDAGIVTLTGNWQLLTKLDGFLSKNNVVVRLVDRPKAVRFSIHAFNSDKDIARTLDLIEKFFFKHKNVFSGGESANHSALWLE